MTMPVAQGGTVQDFIDREVPPDMRFPRLFRVVTMSPISDDGVGEVLNAIGQKVIRWVVKRAHPLSPNSTVLRMYRQPDGVAIYSVTTDGKNGVMNFLPREQVLMTEEVMSPQVLLDELQDRELELSKEPVDDPDEHPEPDTEGTETSPESPPS